MLVRLHVRLCEAVCELVGLFTRSTVAAGLTTLAEWILLATCVLSQFILLSRNAFFKTGFIGVMALVACCII